MSEKIGVMLCGHGSRDVDAIREFQALAGHLAQRLPQYEVDSGFLEFATPIIRTGLGALKAKGVSRILAVPGMLFAAGHVKNDLPWEINSFAAENPDLPITFGRELAIDTKLLAAAKARIEEAEALGASSVERKDTLLLAVGRGTNDPDANSNIAKVARMLWEGMDFGWAEIAFSGVAYPLVDQALERVTKLGYKRVIVFPYFLFTGILVKRIYEWTDQAASAHPAIEFLKAPYLNDHPLVVDSFVERVGEILDGSPAMNCSLCKYREQVVGYEASVGAVQAGHHHHVRGIGTDADHGHDHAPHSHTHSHGHGHGHGHHHHHHN
ncbi:sirohydrochlorin chelatase [Magnetospirillum sp. 15-1]|uniref:sirohydrochlorin chelatase n=1 Tax=Magnetospirillum sp. 15-1 TaxID=1979370 RepID=UPI000BBB6EF5|nr:sirohydrochlorin chelatase [Magnetospirillum sp. 15-1]